LPADPLGARLSPAEVAQLHKKSTPSRPQTRITALIAP
jgi:hypothetical protein